jgi:hypothetical protein
MRNFFLCPTVLLILLTQGCEISYISKITISKDFISTAVTSTISNEDIIKKAFDDYCAKRSYPTQKEEYLFLEKGTEFISQCGKVWFYNIRLWKKPDSYEIELWLMQPGPWRTKTDFFCSQTKEMFDFYRIAFGETNVSYKAYSGCK